ncbi:MAG TPA: D-lyxose/D-mannose family sugar isomerase [Anaerolineales bacterium]|nr:D-lyxose/D-mannose family sugar isomerase [Anaerolineales bacterium]
MKRSEINKIVLETIEFFHTMQFYLPRWACWAASDWKGKCQYAAEIIECGLGWDITDFGSEDFEKVGLINFNLRNGIVNQSKKTYCEKIIVVGENQVTPLHTHYLKFEDIINRGGGNLVIELFQADEKFNPTDRDVTVKIDGLPVTIPAGGKVILTPGESIFLEPGMLHMFYGEPGKGRVLVGEVSTVNDDSTDNHFIGGSPRFPSIIEDEEPVYLLVNDYKKYV